MRTTPAVCTNIDRKRSSRAWPRIGLARSKVLHPTTRVVWKVSPGRGAVDGGRDEKVGLQFPGNHTRTSSVKLTDLEQTQVCD
jgi:hypothetical protein